MSSLLVPIAEISEIREHPNADKLELAIIGGWQVVVGKGIQKYGNHVFVFDDPMFTMPIVSLPVKNDWRDPADPHLIIQSIRELVCIANALDWQSIALPRPGCGAGGLSWPTVEGLLCTRLDDRFVIVDLEAPCQDLR